MPSFAANLEKTLHAALSDAGERRHEYATLEHLLLALIDDDDAALQRLIAFEGALPKRPVDSNRREGNTGGQWKTRIVPAPKATPRASSLRKTSAPIRRMNSPSGLPCSRPRLPGWKATVPKLPHIAMLPKPCSGGKNSAVVGAGQQGLKNPDPVPISSTHTALGKFPGLGCFHLAPCESHERDI